MIEKQQTAVEWLFDNLDLSGGSEAIETLDKAKEMEKQQIQDAYLDGYCETAEDSQDYYYKTYSK